MKTRALVSLWLVLFFSCGVADGPDRIATSRDALVIGPLARRFELSGLSGRCLDFGGGTPTQGSPVYLYRCNGSAAQSVVVEELSDGRHSVRMKGAGGLCIGARGWSTVPTNSLELQICDDRPGQIFQLDGDSILLEQRRMAVRARDWRGDDRTPLVIDFRKLDARERWTFRPLNGFLKPTSGFIAVPLQMTLQQALAQAHSGTVIELDPAFDQVVQGSLTIPAGVTLRGGRTATVPGARLRHIERTIHGAMLVVGGDDVRITGVRLEGPTDSTSKFFPVVVNGKLTLREDATISGISAPSALARTFVDHNELSKWRGSAVRVPGTSDEESVCPPAVTRTANVTVTRNFIHDNRRDGFGYGVSTGSGGFADIAGNFFDDNRHAVTTDGRALSGYRATRNLVSDTGPQQGTWPITWYTQDFDIHGRGEGTFADHRGGVAGDIFEISWNTFLATNRENLDLRGTPCRFVEYVGNISRQSEGDSLNNDGESGRIIGWGNLWSQPDPTAPSLLASADLDGDGVADRLLTTGAAWYVKPGGAGEWRFWNAQTARFPGFSFVDLNDDGRMDVIAIVDGLIKASWGGLSPFEPLFPEPEPPPRADPLPLPIGP